MSGISPAIQVPGHLFGPPAPHIAFYYGSCRLGEVRGHPSSVSAAAHKLKGHITMLEPGPEGMAKCSMLSYGAAAVLYCGYICRPLGKIH